KIKWSFLNCFSHSNRVDQSPLHVFKNKGENAKIDCSHSVPSYNQVNWYKQTQDQSLPEFTNRFRHTRTGTLNGDLTISNLNASDSAVYYCAVRAHSAAARSPSSLKTHNTGNAPVTSVNFTGFKWFKLVLEVESRSSSQKNGLKAHDQLILGCILCLAGHIGWTCLSCTVKPFVQFV
uniref:Ig-like domain-containing protein n=1 Tax=Astyanax mexicanus TaxID=7994 RepID=A0A8B9RJ88_ASTMX